MNLFRFAGDMSHILSFILLLQKIVASKSAAGISLRTQEMYMGACCALVRASARASGGCHCSYCSLGGTRGMYCRGHMRGAC